MILTRDGELYKTSPVKIGETVESLTAPYGVANALQEIKIRNLIPLTTPQFLDLRKDCPDFNDGIWTNWYTTTSGIYNVENKVIVVHGLKHPLTDSQRVRSAVEEGLVNYGAKLTDTEIQAFRERKIEGLRDYEEFLKETQNKDLAEEQYGVVADASLFNGLSNDNVKLAKWVKDPRVIILAGGQRRAEQYAEMLDKKKVEKPWISLDVKQGLVDRGRLAFVGNSNYNDYGLNGNGDLDDYGRFLGVAAEPLSAPKIEVPSAQVPLESRVELLHDGRVLRHEGRLYVLAECLELKQ